MLGASILAHVSLGILLAVVFTLYYINSDGKWKVIIEAIIGVGGNAGIIFFLDSYIPTNDTIIRLYSIAGLILAFVVALVISLLVVSYIIKDRDQTGIIRLRDIMLGQYAFITKYYEFRMKEIDERLSVPTLERRAKELENQEKKFEEEVANKQSHFDSEKTFVKEELAKLDSLGKMKPRLNLPENRNIAFNQEYIEMIPSYMVDMVNCIREIRTCTEGFLEIPKESVDITAIKTHLIQIATFVSVYLFGGNAQDVRIHFRIYDKTNESYVKFVAVMGRKILTQEMTPIPYANDSMIKQSYICKRALIKSINSSHDYQSGNHRMWQDYLTYTFNGLLYEDKPYLSFGISIKNVTRYKKFLYLVNYFRLENFLQESIDQINGHTDIASIVYGNGGAANV